MHPAAIVTAGGVLAGLLDLLYAFSFWGLQGIGPQRILHAVAAGWLGRDAAVAGGGATAALGAVSHFGIAIVMAWIYYAAARKMPALARHPFRCGALYGMLLYGAMTYVVVPLSAAGQGRWPALQASQWLHLAAHILLVGIPCALAARWALRR